MQTSLLLILLILPLLILIIILESEFETAHVLVADHVPPIFKEVLVISEGVFHVAH